ncbi:NADPH-dependent FMN reductase [Halobacillus amylolyticus]|uniref:NAD(P)H-dependent oxidoreductase n=1 Tax=Halobacillus amylolyticus TaxID=2932259 RepID=A0ABY4HAM7_9BACI|nr:NAD(P)H-dependent oxidoreductase [Halobacillus amylolyticus]UOR10460.1 NAD(P)H-dependent oxidoreductase [Halobacillus amylolyticus]
MKVLGLSGSVTLSSKTWLSVKRAVEAAKSADPKVVTELVHLGEYDTVLCDGREPSLYEGDTKALIDLIVEADALIIGTPVYRASLTGALKNVFDLIPNDSLRGKAIGFIATGGSFHHYLVIDHQLNPLANYFRAHVVPGGVYVHNGHFDEGKLLDQDVLNRLDQLGSAAVQLTSQLDKRNIEIQQPSIPRQKLNQS